MLSCFEKLFLASCLNPDCLICFPNRRLSSVQGLNIQVLGTYTILTISSVTEEDYGKYTCVASNRLGVQNSSVFLYSEYKGGFFSLSSDRNSIEACQKLQLSSRKIINSFSDPLYHHKGRGGTPWTGCHSIAGLFINWLLYLFFAIALPQLFKLMSNDIEVTLSREI